VAVRHFLLISDAAAPLVSGEAPRGVMGLARALVAAGASATVLSLASPETAAGVPGLARRLRTFKVRAMDGASTREVALYEGKAPLSQAQMVVAGAEGRDRGESAVLLAEAARALGDDGLLKADVTVAWGETAALALSVVPAAARLFVLPSGRVGGPLTDSEMTAVAQAGIADAGVGGRSLAAIGAAFANAIVTPSESAARLLEADPGIADRASDEPLVALRFGCDDPPHDPTTDIALPANYGAKALTGKLECRRAVTRRYSLATGPRTLLLGTAPLRHGKGGDELMAALLAFAKLDVATLIPGQGDLDLLERARKLAIQSSGRLVVLDSGDAQERVLRAAADAILCVDSDDRTARATGLAQRYGALPIAFDGGACRDYLVDYDPASATGSAILYGSLDSYEIEAAVRRAVALRAAADEFAPLVQRAMETAPRWALTASGIEELAAAFV
jgi:hypothetical protein